MLIVRYQAKSGPVYGIVDKGIVYELNDDIFDSPHIGSKVKPIDAVNILPPVQPGKIIALGRNYAEHAKEHHADIPEQPLIFLKAPSSVIGPGESIQLTQLSQRVEHEAELAVVIGQQCKAVTEAEAWAVVLGVTCANDVTARDLQRADGQWARGKSFDTFCPLGPFIVTHLSPEKIDQLEITCRVNGQVRQHSNTSQMIFKIPYLIAYTTAVMTLYPGDVILTGTPAGVSPLQNGDVVEVDIEDVGVLRNNVIG